MKKAVILSGGKQYLVSEGQELDVELIKDQAQPLSFEPLLVIDGESVSVGTPSLADLKVTASVARADVRDPKVTAIRYKAKKRVHKTLGHRQHKTRLKIDSIG